MACFLDLASETLVQILSLLPCRDLASTSRLSHGMHAISRELLYRSPCLAPGTNPQSTSTPSLEIFLSTILRPGNETLATVVRSLFVEWDNLTRTPPTDISFLAAAASQIDFQYPLVSQAAQLTLLLHFLPRLTALELSPAPSRGCAFGRFMESHNDILPPLPHKLPLALQSLREFRCFQSNLPTGFGISPKAILMLLMLPRIHSIDIHAFYHGRYPHRGLEAAAGCSPVSKLRLTTVTLSGTSLKLMLAVPLALTRFSYSAHHQFDLKRFIQSLAPLQHTLQFLHLDIVGVQDPDSSDDEDPYDYHEPYDAGTFCEWPVLRSLSCPLTALLGRQPERAVMRLVEVLPTCLCEFEILPDVYWRGPELVIQIEDLMAQKEAVLPALQRLAINPSEWNKVVVECKEAGVELVPGPLEW